VAPIRATGDSLLGAQVTKADAIGAQIEDDRDGLRRDDDSNDVSMTF
jgi:hypothetical protein